MSADVQTSGPNKNTLDLETNKPFGNKTDIATKKAVACGEHW